MLNRKKNLTIDKSYQNWYITAMNYKVELLEEAIYAALSLPLKLKAKIQHAIGLLKEFGNTLPEPHSIKIDGLNDF